MLYKEVRMKRVLIGFLCFISSCLVFVPAAVYGAGSNYLVAKGGVYLPQDDWEVLNIGLLDVGLDTGFNGEFAIGHNFDKNWAAEFGIGYFQTSGKKTFPGLQSKPSIDVMPVTLALRGIIPSGKLDIYGIGGIGAYFVSAEEKLNGFKFDDNDVLFGGFIGAGAAYNITSATFIGLEAKYLWTEKTSLSDAGWRQKHKLDGLIATFNFGVRF